MSLFETGTVVMTCGIRDLVCSDEHAEEVVQNCLERHCKGDWGDLCEDDKAMNDESLEAERNGGWTDSLFSSYETDVGKIYVITECDRSATTILLSDEY
jgi:hypothetical protein